MPILPAAVELLAALAPVLDRWGRWYVFGAQAVVLYGVPRLSADVDVTLAIEPDTPEPFAEDMQRAGFSLRVTDPDFVRRTRVMPFVHEPTGMPLDIVFAGSGLEDEFLARAVRTEVGRDTTVPETFRRMSTCRLHSGRLVCAATVVTFPAAVAAVDL